MPVCMWMVLLLVISGAPQGCWGFSPMSAKIQSVIYHPQSVDPLLPGIINPDDIHFKAWAWHAHVGINTWMQDLGLAADVNFFPDRCCNEDFLGRVQDQIYAALSGSDNYQGQKVSICPDQVLDPNDSENVQHGTAYGLYTYFQKEQGNHTESRPIEAAFLYFQVSVGFTQPLWYSDFCRGDPTLKPICYQNDPDCLHFRSSYYWIFDFGYRMAQKFTYIFDSPSSENGFDFQ